MAEDFLRLAKSDLRLAELILADTGVDIRLAGFHAQQAVEKALKAAILMHLGVNTTRTHDIASLLARLPSDWRIQRLEEPLSLLPRWVSAGRYPDALVFFDTQDEQAATDLAHEAMELLLDDLRDVGFRV